MNTKSLIVAIASMGLAASSFAQGTIAFANNASSLVTTNNQQGNIGNSTTGFGTKIQLFYQVKTGTVAPAALDATSALAGTPVNGWIQMPGSASSVGTPLAGRFGPTSVTTGNDVAPAGSVWLQAVAWNGGSTTAANASATATYAGVSGIWSQGTGDGAAVPAVSSAGLFGGIVLIPVPEPSTIALAGLGAASLLLFRRK